MKFSRNSSKKLKTAQQLNIHNAKLHSGITFTCENCGKKISNKGNLTKHMKIHNKHDPLGIEEAEFVIDSQDDMFA